MNYSELGFNTIEEYFDYILESRANGNHRQARRLFYDLEDGMQGPRRDFFDYVEATYYYDACDNGTEDAIRELKQYLGILGAEDVNS